MALKYRSTERFLKADVKYGSKLVTKFINCLMHAGKKNTAESIFYQAMDMLGNRIQGVEPLKVFEQAVENVKPKIEVRSRRVGGATYQVPMDVAPHRAMALALRWIILSARKRKGQAMPPRLADELGDAYNRQGAAYTTRENVHKMAEANKAFAHFAW